MSINARPTILFATATALALSTCGATSSPSTPAASAGSSSADASTDGSFTLLNGLIPVPTGSRSYSKKGDLLSQTTESDKSLRIEEWTKVSLPNLDGTHEIVKTLRLSPRARAWRSWLHSKSSKTTLVTSSTQRLLAEARPRS